MSTRIKIEPYLSNPIFALVAGLLLSGFGFLAIRVAVDDGVFQILLNQIHHDFKRLDSGVTLYHELLTACTSETTAFETTLTLKQEVEEIDALLSQHETELQKLETDTQTQYELSNMALSMFQERFKAFKSDCEF